MDSSLEFRVFFLLKGISDSLHVVFLSCRISLPVTLAIIFRSHICLNSTSLSLYFIYRTIEFTFGLAYFFKTLSSYFLLFLFLIDLVLTFGLLTHWQMNSSINLLMRFARVLFSKGIEWKMKTHTLSGEMFWEWSILENVIYKYKINVY